jgi:uncharacterized membrane protein
VLLLTGLICAALAGAVASLVLDTGYWLLSVSAVAIGAAFWVVRQRSRKLL